MAQGEQWAETGVGAVVLAAAAAFLVYALGHAGGGRGGRGYDVVARFGSVGGLAPGADVRVAGVKVGTVSRIELDPKTFLAVTHMSLNGTVHVPEDSTVKITSDSLLGGQHMAIQPGGSAADLKPGQEFANTQGAVDIFGLIGQVLRPQGAAAAASPAAATPSAPAGAAKGSTDPYPGGG